MNVLANKNARTVSFYKISKVSISALSFVICGFAASSAMADTFSNDTYSDRECVELSRQYDDTVLMNQLYDNMMETTHIGNDPLFSRTDLIEIGNSRQHIESDINSLRNKLITDCPDYAEGL